MIGAEVLRGMAKGKADCYGKPHVGAYYAGRGVRTNRLADDARCCICGSSASNSHHNPPVGSSGIWTLNAPCGSFALKPALVAVCGSGNTGCHDMFHGSAMAKMNWVWRSDSAEDEWYSGRALMHAEPHSEDIYELGFWRITLDGIVFKEIGR